MKGIAGREWLVVCKVTSKKWWVTSKKKNNLLRSDRYIIVHMSSKDLAKWEKVA